MINNSHKKYLVLSFIFLLFSSLFFLFLFKGIKDNNKIVKQADLDWTIESKRQTDLETLDSSLKALADGKVLFDSHFANNSEAVPFLDKLEQLADKVSAIAEVFSVEQKTDTTEGAKPNLIVGLKVAGSFEAIYKFITLLENAPYELEIMSMSMDKVEGESQTVDGEIQPSKWSSSLKVKLISFIP